MGPVVATPPVNPVKHSDAVAVQGQRFTAPGVGRYAFGDLITDTPDLQEVLPGPGDRRGAPSHDPNGGLDKRNLPGPDDASYCLLSNRPAGRY